MHIFLNIILFPFLLWMGTTSLQQPRAFLPPLLPFLQQLNSRGTLRAWAVEALIADLYIKIQSPWINAVSRHHFGPKTQHFLCVKTILSHLIVLWLPEHLPCEDINYPTIKRPSFSVMRELFFFYLSYSSLFYSFQLNRSCLGKRKKMGLNAN